MILRAIERKDLEQLRINRRDMGNMLRTETDITELSQEEWYKKISDRNSKMKFWAIDNDGLIGYCSLDFDYKNGWAELGLVLGKDNQKKGYGTLVVHRLLNKAFKEYRMCHVYFECYFCNPALGFWEKVADRFNAKTVIMPSRKFWNGRYYDSLFGVIYAE